jgi:integrase
MPQVPEGLKFRDNRSWYLWLTLHGRRTRESLHTRDLPTAIERARRRLEELERYGPLAIQSATLRFEGEFSQQYIRDQEINDRRSVGKAKKTVQHLGSFFNGRLVKSITTADITEYIAKRKRAGYANGSINRELAALKRMYKLAVNARLLSRDHVPVITLLQEASPRSGFFERDAFHAVLHHLPPAIRPVAMFAHETGWRLREVLNLEWRQVDLTEGVVRLDAGSTKNRAGRLVYVSPALLEVLQQQGAATQALQKQRATIIPWVFHRNGDRILRFLGSWRTACRKAGVPGMLFHDLRRTAIRNMVRAGIPERVAMQVSGHKTRSVFERYNIVSESDLREAARRLDAAQSRSNGHVADPRTLPDGRTLS